MEFGISKPEQTKQVGSACVKTIGESQNPVETAKKFAAEFRSALTEVKK